MGFLKDEGGQSSAEYILVFGGVIIVAIAALLIYNAYFTSSIKLDALTDVNTVRGSAIH